MAGKHFKTSAKELGLTETFRIPTYGRHIESLLTSDCPKGITIDRKGVPHIAKRNAKFTLSAKQQKLTA